MLDFRTSTLKAECSTGRRYFEVSPIWREVCVGIFPDRCELALYRFRAASFVPTHGQLPKLTAAMETSPASRFSFSGATKTLLACQHETD